MAQRFDVQPEFWLPSEFLTDGEEDNNHFGFPSDFPLDFDQSVKLTELTRQLNLQKPNRMTHYGVPGSPQSTLFQFGGSSNDGSPNGHSQASSPRGSNLLNLIHQAATQVAKLKVNGAGEVPLEKSYNALYNSFIQRAREEQILKQQQLLREAMLTEQLKQNRFSRGNVGGYFGNDENAWPSLQFMMQQNLQKRAGGRDVAPTGGSGNVKKPSAGTGVFLPRHYENNCVQTKTGYSTTTFHGRGDMNNAHIRGGGGPPRQWQPRRFGGHCSDYGEVQLAEKNAMLMHQRREQVALGQELGLPQEWTY